MTDPAGSRPPGPRSRPPSDPEPTLGRPSRIGLVAAATGAVVGVAWLRLTEPPGPLAAYLVWLVAVVALAAVTPGLANQVTLVRAYLAAAAFAYGLRPQSLGLLALTVALAGLSDLADGAVARRWDRPSQLGGGLDPVVDGLFFGAAAVALAIGGAYPAWLAGLVVARYALPALAGLVLLAGRSAPPLRHTIFGQVSTSLIAVLLGWVALWRGIGQDPAPIVVVASIVIPAATALTFANLGWVAWRARRGGLDAVRPG